MRKAVRLSVLACLVACRIGSSAALGTAREASEKGAPLDENSVLEDYLAYAERNNPELRGRFNRWQAALEQIPQAKALPDPRLAYACFLQEVETRVGPQRHKVGIAQTFPWFGKLGLRKDVAMKRANAERERYASAKLDLFYRVEKIYRELYYLGRAASVTDENIRLMTFLEEVARTRYAAGATPHSDVVRAQVELGRLEDRLRSLEELKTPLLARFNSLLNRPSDAAVALPQQRPRSRPCVSEEALSEMLSQRNPRLKAIELDASAHGDSARLAERDFYPDITVGLEYIETGGASVEGVDDDGKDPVLATVSVNLPLWREKYRAAEEEALLKREAALSEKRDVENELAADLSLALYHFRDAERKIDLYESSLLPKAKQSLNVAQQAFTTGQGSFLEIVDAERTLLEFQLSLERSVTNRAQRLAEIEMIVGIRGTE